MRYLEWRDHRGPAPTHKEVEENYVLIQQVSLNESVFFVPVEDVFMRRRETRTAGLLWQMATLPKDQR